MLIVERPARAGRRYENDLLRICKVKDQGKVGPVAAGAIAR